MATWTGWQAQFLNAANLPNTAPNRQFLGRWSQYANTSCRNNPIDVSRKQGNSSNCSRLTGSRTAQNYTSHGQAATGFANEIRSGNFPHLLAAFASGDAFTIKFLPTVEADLLIWGSTRFEKWLEDTFGISPGGGGIGGGATYTPHSIKGWGDLRTTVNMGLPAMLSKVARLNRATSTALQRRRRVRR